MSSTSHVSYDAFPMADIDLIPGTSHEFDVLLRKVADDASISSMQMIAPYSVIIKNNTPERLIGITVRFYLTDASGRTVWHQMTVGTRNNRSSSMIAPGEAVLVTPETGLNAVLRLGVPVHITETPMLTSRLAKHLNLYSRQDRVRIAVDSVIFEDGGLIGEDNSRMLEMLNAWAAAEDTVMEKVFSRHGSDITAYLASVRDAATEVGGSLAKTDHFAKHKREFAEDLFSQRNALNSEEEFFSFVRTKRLSRIPVVQRRRK